MKSQPCILLRSSWSEANIGSRAHTPGDLSVLKKYVPEAKIVLWAPSNLPETTIQHLKREFPRLEVVKGTIEEDGAINGYGAKHPPNVLAEAVDKSDFLLHGSCSHFRHSREVSAYVHNTGKPFGVLGITYSDHSGDRELLSQAQFIYFRDSLSLQKAKDAGITCPIMEFGPDSAFCCELRSDLIAEAYLNAHHLKEGKFICVIGRLRHTPYWELTPGSHINLEKYALNEQMQEQDHTPLREAICALVEETDLRILVCPEDRTQMAVGKKMIIDRLPKKVLSRIVWRENFWSTDEALSVYIRSAGLFGIEMHSQIMCIGNGVPAIVCRSKEHTSKGLMWKDIGLRDWLFDLDKPDEMKRLTPTVLNMVQRPDHSKEKVEKAKAYVHNCNLGMAEMLRRYL